MVVGTALGFSDWGTVALAVALAFVFGYTLTSVPLLRAGMALSAVVPIALATDTVSIAVMEVVDNAIMLVVPGALEAGLGDLLFWGSLSIALVIAGLFALPVNRWLLARGKGHAVVHETGIHGGPPTRVSPRSRPSPPCSARSCCWPSCSRSPGGAMLARMPAPRLESPRLVLREFTPADVAPYAATIADPEVMRFMGSGWRYRLKRGMAGVLASVSHAEARLDLRRIRRHWERHGWGEWAVEERAGGELVGRVGFKYHPDFTADPCQVEIGWLLARRFWGRGYATEAAEMALAEGFGRLGLERVVSISSPAERALGRRDARPGHGRGGAHPLARARRDLDRYRSLELGGLNERPKRRSALTESSCADQPSSASARDESTTIG